MSGSKQNLLGVIIKRLIIRPFMSEQRQRFFKKIEGVSPRAYLQKLRGGPGAREDSADVD